MMGEVRDNNWYCVDKNCGAVLGHIVGRELLVASDARALTEGANLVVTCPKCGRSKVFYSSDPVVRALNQLLDALVSTFASRAVRVMHRESLNLDLAEEDEQNV